MILFRPFRFLFSIVDEIGRTLMFLGDIVHTLFRKPCRVKDIVDQTWSVTMQSLPTTAMAGFFVGAIMAVQFTLQMRDFGALGYLGGLATSGTIREVGPLLIAFMLAGKVGAYTSAELGTIVKEDREAKVLSASYTGSNFSIPVPGYHSELTSVISTGQ